MKAYRHIGGFTYLELIVAIVIIAVLAAVASMRFNPTDSTAPYQADLLARNIRHMQMLAMTWGQTLRLTATSSGYSIACATGTTGPCTASPVLDSATGSAFSVVLANSVTMSGPATDIDSLGRPVSGTTPLTTKSVFTLNAGTQTWSVTVAPITGFVTVSTP
ncbi:MAG: type II secretion system protein [Acidiferrobacterales bacterium]